MDTITNNALVLAGVRKSGTTTLFDMLARHSMISPASAKESQYFACDPETVRNNLTWYRKLFHTDTDMTLLDGSTWYFGAPDAPHLINQLMPNARIVLCLRDPAERAYSGYLHMKKQTPSRDKRSFSDIVSELGHHTQRGQSLTEAENLILNEAAVSGITDADYISENFHKERFSAPFETRLQDRRYSFRYFTESSYRLWLPAWESTFRNRLLIVYFEDLMNMPSETIKTISDFAGLDHQEDTFSLSKKNITRVPKGKAAEMLISIRKNTAIGRFSASLFKRLGLRAAGQSFRENILYADKDQPIPSDMDSARHLLIEEYNYWKSRDSRIDSLWTAPNTD